MRGGVCVPSIDNVVEQRSVKPQNDIDLKTLTVAVLSEDSRRFLPLTMPEEGISASNNWENTLSCPIDRRLSVAPAFRTAVASMGWLVGPLGFEPRTNGL